MFLTFVALAGNPALKVLALSEKSSREDSRSHGPGIKDVSNQFPCRGFSVVVFSKFYLLFISGWPQKVVPKLACLPQGTSRGKVS